MCNAKNHRWNCDCGFGGDSHLTKGTPNAEVDQDLFSVPRIPRHYTKPNARCPVCSASVFFYTLENNGRVFFDEIGPPWPKHACTAGAAEPDPTSAGDGSSLRRQAQGRSADGGWRRLTQVAVEVAEQNTLRLSGKLEGQDLVAFVRSDVFGDMSAPATYLGESYIQTRPSRTSRFDLALLTPELRPILIVGFATAADAASSEDN